MSAEPVKTEHLRLQETRWLTLFAMVDADGRQQHLYHMNQLDAHPGERHGSAAASRHLFCASNTRTVRT